MCAQNPILGRQVFILEEQFLVDQTGDESEQPNPFVALSENSMKWPIGAAFSISATSAADTLGAPRVWRAAPRVKGTGIFSPREGRVGDAVGEVPENPWN
jgi:hypothetical protein